MNTLKFTRRRLVSLASAIPIAGALGPALIAQQSSPRTATPRQTEGPYYPRSKPADIDNDLAKFGNRDTNASGDSLLVSGRVYDRQGSAVAGARVELWHCDHLGQYHHVGASGLLDNNFQGYGEMVTDAEGHYRFSTVKPGTYPGRTRHIHFKVIAPGRRPLTSQMYFQEDMASNLRDGIYRRLTEADRAAVTLNTLASPAGSQALEGVLDIVLA